MNRQAMPTNPKPVPPDDEATTRARIVAEVCERVIGGESVASVFRSPSPGFPSIITFWRWIHADADLEAEYLKSTGARAEKYADEIVEIADSAASPLLDAEGVPYRDGNGNVILVSDRTATEHAKLRIDARKWNAARMLPKRFGDRTVLAGDPDNPLLGIDGAAVLGKLFPSGPPSSAADREPKAD